jgi:molybdopterin converting factor subunit 1
MPIRINVLYFAQARDAAGTDAESVSLPTTSSVKMLVSQSMKAHQRLKGMSDTIRIAVNEEIAAEDDRLADGDTVAFLPPIAGG